MRKIVFACLFLLGSLSVQAQQPNPQKYDAETRAKKHTEMMNKELHLSEDQSAKAFEYVYAFEKKRQKDQEVMKANRAELDKNLSTVLSPEQMEKYIALRKEKAEELKKRSGQMHQSPERKSSSESPVTPSKE